MVGCASALTVTVDRAGGGPLRVELRVPGHDVAYAAECPARASVGCSGDFTFPAFTPERVEVRVITARGTRDTSVGPLRYEAFQPNGPRCAPTCRLAWIRVTAP